METRISLPELLLNQAPWSSVAMKIKRLCQPSSSRNTSTRLSLLNGLTRAMIYTLVKRLETALWRFFSLLTRIRASSVAFQIVLARTTVFGAIVSPFMPSLGYFPKPSNVGTNQYAPDLSSAYVSFGHVRYKVRNTVSSGRLMT